MRQLGRHVRAIDVQIDELNDRLTPLLSDRAPELLALHGVGVDVAAICWSRGTTRDGSGQRRPSQRSAGLRRFQRHRERLLGTASVVEVTEVPTALSGASS